MFASSQMFTSQNGSAQSPEKKLRQEEKMTCVPVTVRVIEAAIEQAKVSGEELRIHGQEQGMLVLVALAETVLRQPASLEISANDSTGRIIARHYITGAGEEQKAVAPGRYVSMVGTVRISPEPHFAVASMRAVESADEVSYHMIEATHAALTVGRDPATPASKAQIESLTPAKSVTADVSMAPAPAGTAAPKVAPEGPALREALLGLLKGYGEEKPQGESIDVVCERVAPGAKDAVRAMLQQLVEEAEVYNTIDEDHFNIL